MASEERNVVAPQFVGGLQPQWHLEVDAARLLLILNRFAHLPGADAGRLSPLAKLPFVRHFASEYYLQKLDFLLRYPRYFAFELIELHAANDGPAADAGVAVATIRRVLGEKEPELHTEPFRRFWRGAYERIDDVEGWWFSRELVCMGREIRGKPMAVGASYAGAAKGPVGPDPHFGSVLNMLLLELEGRAVVDVVTDVLLIRQHLIHCPARPGSAEIGEQSSRVEVGGDFRLAFSPFCELLVDQANDADLFVRTRHKNHAIGL